MKNFSTNPIVIAILLLFLLRGVPARIASSRSQLAEFVTPAKTAPVLTSVSLLAETALGKYGGACGLKSQPTFCPDDCCYSDFTNNQCGGFHKNVCDYTPDAATIGCGSCCGVYACYSVSSDSGIGPSSCHVDYACDNLQSSTLGPYTCIGNYACAYMTSSVVYQSSCKGSYACTATHSSTFAENSCTTSSRKGVCWHCDNSKVPPNECNNLPDGWFDPAYYNYCRFCTNCKDESTKQSCYVSSVSASVSALALSDSNSGDDTECTKLITTITTLFQSLDDDALKKLIGKYVTSMVKKNSDVCSSQLYFTFEHLNEDELVSTCDALEAVFAKHVGKLLTFHPLYADMTLSCEPKDLNAGKGQEIQEWPKELEEEDSAAVFTL